MTQDGLAVLYSAARWLGYLAAFLLLGSAATRFIVWPRAARAGTSLPPGSGVARLAVLAGAMLVVARAAQLYLQSRSLLEPDEPLTGELVRVVLDTTWGRGWTAQLGAALAATLTWGVLARWPRAVWASALAIGAVLAVAATAPLTGHAVALDEAGRLGPVLDGLHFGAGGAWLGTLAVMAFTAFPRRDGAPRPTRELFAAFSPVALVCGLVAIGAGLVLGYRYLGGLEPLVTTTYGRALLLKIGLLAGVAGVGAWNWRIGLPRLRAGGAPVHMRRSAWLELGLGTLLLVVTAVLVALPAPRET